MQRPRRIAGPAKATWPLAGSLALHAALAGALGWVAYRSMAEGPPPAQAHHAAPSPGLFAIDLPAMGDGSLVADREAAPEGEAPARFGGAAIARIDTGSPGAGGDATGARATNLAAIDDRMDRSMDLLSRLDRDQVQRLKTGAQRTTREDRRATTNPMELTFVSTGQGSRPERRPPAETDPSRGSLVSGAPSVVGGEPGAEEAPRHAPGRVAGAARAGEARESPGRGVRDGRPGAEHRTPARVAYARPLVTEGAPTIPGVWRGRPTDTVDSEQEVSRAVQSLIHASFAGGLAGDGRGGAASLLPDPGAGGGAAGRGSLARPLGAGDGELVDWDTNDPMLVPYFREIHAKVNPLWANAFPRSAALALKQGTVILEITIAADGTANVGWPPLRPSGIDEFDRNCADAVRRASPFGPLPKALLQEGRQRLRVRAPFVAKNPVVK